MLTQIIHDIQKQYLDLVSPNYDFVTKLYNNCPYEDVLNEIAKSFKVKDDTDLNYDVSFVYYLSRDRTSYLLRLSMIGKYATLVGRDSELISTSKSHDDLEIGLIFSILHKYNIMVLDSSILLRPIKMKLFATSDENVRIYQALFEDTDVIPFKP